MQTTTQTGGEDGWHLGERLQLLLERELSPEEEARARAHLAECGKCRGEEQKLAGAMTALAAMGRARAPEGFAQRVMKRVRSQRRTAGLRVGAEQKVPFEGGIIVLLAAAMAAALLAYQAHVHGGLFAKNDARQGQNR